MQLRGGLAGDGQNLRGEQRQDDSILIGGPHSAILAKEGGSCTFLTTETKLSTDQTWNEVLEAHGDLNELSANRISNAVDECRRDQGLTDRSFCRPVRAMREEVFDGNGQVVVRVHQTVGGHDSVTVRVGIVTGRNVVGSVSVLVRSHRIAKRSHCIGRGAVHTDLSIPVQGHEGPCGVNLGVHNGQFQAVALGNRAPVVHRCST